MLLGVGAWKGDKCLVERYKTMNNEEENYSTSDPLFLSNYLHLHIVDLVKSWKFLISL